MRFNPRFELMVRLHYPTFMTSNMGSGLPFRWMMAERGFSQSSSTRKRTGGRMRPPYTRNCTVATHKLSVR